MNNQLTFNDYLTDKNRQYAHHCRRCIGDYCYARKRIVFMGGEMMEIIEIPVINKVNRDFKSCDDCTHRERSYEMCVLAQCVHAFKNVGLKECYQPKDGTLPEADDPIDFEKQQGENT